MRDLSEIVKANRDAVEQGVIPPGSAIGTDGHTCLVERTNPNTGAKVMVREPVQVPDAANAAGETA